MNKTGAGLRLLEHQIDQHRRHINEVNWYKRLIDLYGLKRRYLQGERSDELHQSIESLE